MKFARALRTIGIIGCGVVLVALLALTWLWNSIASSLPPLEGTFQITGLTAPAEIDRYEQGTVIIQAANRIDAARALGFAHGQDRFFQIDLSRRRAAGELATLVGDAASLTSTDMRLRSESKANSCTREPSAAYSRLSTLVPFSPSFLSV